MSASSQRSSHRQMDGALWPAVPFPWAHARDTSIARVVELARLHVSGPSTSTSTDACRWCELVRVVRRKENRSRRNLARSRVGAARGHDRPPTATFMMRHRRMFSLCGSSLPVKFTGDELELLLPQVLDPSLVPNTCAIPYASSPAAAVFDFTVHDDYSPLRSTIVDVYPPGLHLSLNPRDKPHHGHAAIILRSGVDA